LAADSGLCSVIFAGVAIERAIPPDNVLEAWAGVLSGERVDVLASVVPMSAANYEKGLANDLS
jgi:hypothetical protein